MNNKKEFTILEGIAYLIGAVGIQLTSIVVVQWVPIFYSPPIDSKKIVYTSIGLVSIMMMIGRIMDVISDPLIGYLSDITKTKLGRRRPYIIYGALPLALSFILIWFPPVPKHSFINFIYASIFISLYWWLFTVVLIPYIALLPEMAHTDQGRVKLGIYSSVGMILGLFIGFSSGIIIEKFGFRIMAVIMGIAQTICFLITGFVIKERFNQDIKTSLSPAEFFKQLYTTLKNKPFLIYAVSCFLFNLGFYVVQMALPYFMEVVIGEKESAITIFMSAFAVMTVITFFPINFLSKKLPIKTIYAGSLLFMSILLPFMYLIGKYSGEISKFTLGLILVGLAGIPQAALYVFNGPLLGQVIDYDEIYTGKRREAIYSGAIGFLTKLGMTFSSVVMWFLFRNFGYSYSKPLGVLLIGPAAGLIAFFGFLIFCSYPLLKTPKKSRVI